MRDPHLPVSDTFVMHLLTGEATALEPEEGSCVTEIQNSNGDCEIGIGQSVENTLDQ